MNANQNVKIREFACLTTDVSVHKAIRELDVRYVSTYVQINS